MVYVYEIKVQCIALPALSKLVADDILYYYCCQYFSEKMNRADDSREIPRIIFSGNKIQLECAVDSVPSQITKLVANVAISMADGLTDRQTCSRTPGGHVSSLVKFRPLL